LKARFGITATLISDNGPQFDSPEMKQFAQLYEFQHTASPYYPQANGLAVVKTVKIVGQAVDPYKTLLSYQATPLPWCGLSPQELLKKRWSSTK